jgi:selenocysteine lyase/cysteine desulfurase
VRASFYLYNTVEEIASLHDALRKALRILRR